jgi:hypothetical protein
VKITVNTYDTNIGTSMSQTGIYHAKKGDQITISAPEIDDEKLVEWDLGGKLEFAGYLDEAHKLISVRIPDNAENEIGITAKYCPVINKIEVKLDTPSTGQKLQTVSAEDTMKVTISKKYVISPDFVKIRWSPEPAAAESDNVIADQGIAYTATLSIVPKKDETGADYIMAKMPGDAEYTRMSGDVAFNSNTSSKVNENSAALNAANKSVSFTFPKTDMEHYNLVSITKPGDISDIPYGTDASGIRNLLPKTVKLLVDNGMELDGEVEWTLTEDSGDIRRAVVWTCTGNVTLPQGVDNNDNIPLGFEVVAVVNEAEQAKSPVATLDSGTLLTDSVTTLTTMQEGGKTYYTLDGSEPTTDSTLYNGETIIISRHDTEHIQDEVYVDEEGEAHFTGRKVIYLNAFTVCDGMWESEAVTYQYIFDNAVPVMTGEEFIYSGSEYYLVSDSGNHVPVLVHFRVRNGIEIVAGLKVDLQHVDAGVGGHALTLNDLHALKRLREQLLGNAPAAYVVEAVFLEGQFNASFVTDDFAHLILCHVLLQSVTVARHGATLDTCSRTQRVKGIVNLGSGAYRLILCLSKVEQNLGTAEHHPSVEHRRVFACILELAHELTHKVAGQRVVSAIGGVVRAALPRGQCRAQPLGAIVKDGFV